MTLLFRKPWSIFAFGLCLGFSVLVASAVAAIATYNGRVLPRVSVGSVRVGGLTEDALRAALTREAEQLLASPVTLTHQSRVVATPRLSDLGLTVPVSSLAREAFGYGRRGAVVMQAREWLRSLTGVALPFRVALSDQALADYAARFLGSLVVPARSAMWAVEGNALVFVPGAVGQAVDTAVLRRDILQMVTTGSSSPVALQLVSRPPAVSDAEVAALRGDVERVLVSPATLVLVDRQWMIPVEMLRTLMTVERVGPRAAVTFQREALARYLEQEITPAVNRPGANARFELTEGRATLFTAPQDGIALKVAESVEGIRLAIAGGSAVGELVVNRTPPAIRTTDDLQRLGIQGFLARGETDFKGSPRNRIHNIRVGAERFHGALIPPGATFGFNEQLGPVLRSTGYKPELVILQNVTTPQYGGGLCQVSTTMFRAVVLAGLKVVERKPHAYPVSYYGTPGFDATIYPNQRTWKDGTDLKFINDTPGHILIQTNIEGTKLSFEFWGTPDGRDVKVVGPRVVSRGPGGSLKATMTQQVYRGGTLEREEKFFSAYKSPRLFPRVLAANAERESWEALVQRVTEKDRRVQEEFLRKQRETSWKPPRPSPTPVPGEE